MDIPKKLNGLSLFTGVAGIDIALSDFIRPVAYCEIDPYCQSVLLSRMQEGNLPEAPIWDDVCTLPFDELPPIDIIIAGFPCQGVSVAGHGKGLEDKRSGLFFEIMRLAKEIKPKFLFLENVSAISTRGGLQVVREITEAGYDCRFCTISAASVGALHKRERWFLLANSTSESADGHTFRAEKEHSLSRISSDDGNPDSISSEQTDQSAESEHLEREAWREHTGFYRPFKSRDDWQKTVSEMGKCIDGLSGKLDFNTEQLRALGNSVVPQQVRRAWEILTRNQ